MGEEEDDDIWDVNEEAEAEDMETEDMDEDMDNDVLTSTLRTTNLIVNTN